MPIAAIPDYLGNDFSAASPGLRFGMYLKLWGVNNRTHEPLWTTHDVNYRVAGRDREERQFRDENKTSALRAACALTANDMATFVALGHRQTAIATACGDKSMLVMDAQSIAPFSTGLGNEHPLENGFAFLNPYGLPYLPGSGVKGVLRRAAVELERGEWNETKGWTKDAIHTLFGAEPETDLVRGVLSFWDVIPQINGNALAVDIMTPHQTHYYQQGETPHESGSPNPISFLTVPPKSGFTFYVQCDTARLKIIAQDLAENDRWKILLTAAFEHAFDWLGFGAKTSVGYGAMESGAQKAQREAETARRQQAERERQEAEAIKRRAENAQIWSGARIKFNRANGTLTVEKDGKSAYAYAPKGNELLNALPAAIQQKIRTNQFVKVTASVAEGTVLDLKT